MDAILTKPYLSKLSNKSSVKIDNKKGSRMTFHVANTSNYVCINNFHGDLYTHDATEIHKLVNKLQNSLQTHMQSFP